MDRRLLALLVIPFAIGVYFGIMKPFPGMDASMPWVLALVFVGSGVVPLVSAGRYPEPHRTRARISGVAMMFMAAALVIPYPWIKNAIAFSALGVILAAHRGRPKRLFASQVQ